MKRILFTLSLVVTAAWCATASVAFGQEPVQLGPEPLHAYYTYFPLRGVTTEEAMRGAAAATTIPMWAYSITSSRDGNPYSGVMVGRSPFFHGARTTNIPTFIVPVKIKMPASGGSGVFDPSVADSTCLGGKVPTTVFQNSPLFQSSAFTMNGQSIGTTQYIDAFQRANFFAENVSATGDRYHTKLGPITTLSVQTFNVPTNGGAGFTGVPCGKLGVMDISAFDTFVQGTIVPLVAAQTGGGPTSLPIILLYNVVMANPFVPNTTANCCILGYHSSFASPVQTYSVADFESTGAFGAGTNDVSAPSHEIGEWIDDPLGNNLVPLWGNIGQVGGCQGNLEVGDPLSGTLFPSITLSGFTYHVQELAFFSWFLGGPSIGAGADFSNNGTFLGDAVLCPPGGTN
jgi:hypothetical protein